MRRAPGYYFFIIIIRQISDTIAFVNNIVNIFQFRNEDAKGGVEGARNRVKN